MAPAMIATQPSKAQDFRGAVNIPAAKFPSASKPEAVQPKQEVDAVLDNLNRELSRADYQAVSDLFTESGFWRDHLALSWKFRTVKGRDSIREFLHCCGKSKDGFRLKKIALDSSSAPRQPRVAPVDGEGNVIGIQAFLLIVTAVESGEGFMRLVLQEGKWKIFTFYTCLREIRGCEELSFHRRPLGVDHGEKAGRINWSDKRRLESKMGDDHDLSVLIVGAGQGGLTVASRLKMLGLSALVIDQNDRVGDNWRKRYHQLVLHDPVWYDHLPYVPFPPSWPVFTPKDKLAQFFEAYANLMEINLWMRSTITSSKWDEQRKIWTVTVSRKADDGSTHTQTLHPRHIIQATGHSGQKYVPQIEGSESFKGDRICHSAEFPGARQGTNGKKAVVVGSCNSAHDIAQDFFENGYDITMVQRSSTLVVTSKAVTEVGLKSLYSEDGPPVEDADLILQSLPGAVLKALQITVTELQKQHDMEILTGLQKAGFKIDFGPDDTGLFMKYFQRGGGYYIDVGASKLIADGSIKVKQGQEVAKILPHGIQFADGSKLDADEIVLATGYQNMRSHTRQIFGDDVADRVHDVWGLDEEGELQTMWRPSGHPGFWFHGGNLALCRYYSRLLALQIKGQEEGLYSYGET